MLKCYAGKIVRGKLLCVSSCGFSNCPKGTFGRRHIHKSEHSGLGIGFQAGRHHRRRSEFARLMPVIHKLDGHFVLEALDVSCHLLDELSNTGQVLASRLQLWDLRRQPQPFNAMRSCLASNLDLRKARLTKAAKGR